MSRKLVEAVIEHAVDHYEVEGWDILVECWSDEESGRGSKEPHQRRKLFVLPLKH